MAINFPEGTQNFPSKVLQCKTNYDSSMITVANTSGNQGSQFGLTSLRVYGNCLLYTSPSPRDGLLSRMPSSA